MYFLGFLVVSYCLTNFSLASLPDIQLENTAVIPDLNKSEVVNQKKMIQRSRLERSVASETDLDKSRTKVVGYLLFLLLPLLLGAWFIKKKGY